MSDAVRLAIHSVKRGRQLKFTPERIEQIITLVERGKTRNEIAELIGVTTAKLQVTCSKLGISLRRRYFDTGVRLLRRKAIRSSTETYDAHSRKLRDAALRESDFEATRKAMSESLELLARVDALLSGPPTHRNLKEASDLLVRFEEVFARYSC